MDAWSSYQEMPHDQVDWANLAQQWMAMKETEPVDDRNGTAYDGGGPWEAGKPIFPSANLEPERYNRGPNDGYNNRGAEYWGDEWGQSGNGHFHPPRPHQHPYGAPNNYPPYPHRNEPMPYQQAPRPLRNGGYESFREPDRGYDQFNEPNRGYDRYREGDHSGSWIPPANQMHRPQMQGGPAPHGGPPMQGIPPHGFFNHARLSASAFDHQPAGPIGGTMKPATPPMFTGSFADLDANARKKLPAWILEGLEKAEREKQKQTEKEERIKRAEEERAKRRALAGKGKFDSDSEEENDDADDERSRTVSAPLFDDGDPVFQARKVDPEEDLRTEEERRADAMTAVKFIMMSLLMESTDIMLRENIDSAIKASLVSRKEAAPKLISKSSALAALSSLGDDDDEESASDVEDSKSQTNGDSNTNDAVTFKAPLGIPRNFSKPDPPKQQGDTSPVVCNVKSPTAPQAVKDDSVDTDVVKITEERKRKRSRSRSREKKRSRSKDRDRKRSLSRERKRSRSRDREKKRSRSRERKRSRSRDRKRSRSKERRRRSRSGSKEKKKSAKKSRDRKRSRTRSRSRERRHR